jgi:immunity protein 5 of polymorphic toxin system
MGLMLPEDAPVVSRETIACVTVVSGDFELTMDELRAVTRFVAESAETVLPLFEDAQQGDTRPRAAIEAAWEFVNGAARTKLQRVASLDAHRAAKESGTEIARLAARSAGDAASAAYLHPIAQASQVGHILRAAASSARIAEIQAGDNRAAGTRAIEDARRHATRTVIDVLRRYPPAPAANNRVSQLMVTLDASLRANQPDHPIHRS